MGNAVEAYDKNFVPTEGLTLNPYGIWVDANGDIAKTASGDYQRTPGADANNAHMGTDPRGIQWMSNNATGGEKSYSSPMTQGIKDDPHYNDGGFFRGDSRWDSKTGTWEKGGVNWGNIMSLAVGGMFAAPALAAVAGGAAAGGGTGAAAGTAGATGAAGAIPGASLGMSAALPGAVSSIPALAGTAATTGGGLMTALNAAKAIKGGTQIANAIGKYGANSRNEQLNVGMNAETLQNQREAENRAERADAWKRLQQAEYMINSKGYQPSDYLTSKWDQPRAGAAPSGPAYMAPSDTERQGAMGMRDEVLKRLMGGGLKDPDYAAMAKPSGWEKAANAAGIGMQVAGMFL